MAGYLGLGERLGLTGIVAEGAGGLALIYSGVDDLRDHRVPGAGDPETQRIQEVYDAHVRPHERSKFWAWVKIGLGTALGAMCVADVYSTLSS